MSKCLMISLMFAIPFLSGQGCPPAGTPYNGGGGGGGGGGGTVENDLDEGSTSVYLAAGQAKGYDLHGTRGENWIFNSTVPDSSTDVDLQLYKGNDLVDGSYAGDGRPDNINYTLPSSGEYELVVSNYSDDYSARCTINWQVVEPNSSVSSNLNGSYNVVEVNGQSVPSTTAETWIFDNGRLVSRYVFIDGSLLGTSQDLEVWVNHRSGQTTGFYFGNAHFLITTGTSRTTVSGSSVSIDLPVSENIYFDGEQTTMRLENSFEGRLQNNGQELVGDVEVDFWINGSYEGGYTASVRLLR